MMKRSILGGRGFDISRIPLSAATTLLALLVAGGCASTTQPGAVGANRSQFLLVSSDTVAKESATAYQQVVTQSKTKGTLNTDPKQTERVRRIAAKLIPQTGVFRPDAPKWQWEVNVLQSDEVNAWCMAGGKIVVYTGIIYKLKLTDDELAAVMGHEIAHALREHARERVSQQLASQTVVSIASMALGLGSTGDAVGGAISKVTFELPYSRLHETEADRIGVELAARAGYDPRAAVGLWQKMGKLGGSKPPELLSTHPADETRMKDLEVYSAKVMPLYEAARG